MQIVSFYPIPLYDEQTAVAVRHNLTLFNFAETLQSASSVYFALCLVDVPLKSVFGTIHGMNNNSTPVISCGPLKMPLKAIV